jgi:putative transposase
MTNGHRSLDVGRDESYALIDQLSEQEPVEMVCKAFEVSRSSYYDYRRRRSVVDAERVILRAECEQNLSQESKLSRKPYDHHHA